jgi:predicted ATPase
MRRETQPVQEVARRLIELSEQKRLPMFRPFGLIYQGWAEALGGGGGPAIAQIRDGLAAWRAMGHRSGNPFLLGLLAEALRHSGAWDEALSTVDEGLALAVEIGAPHRPDLYRLKGELLNSRPTPTRVGEPPVADEAVACFQTAITEARQHGLKLLELRATVSLARLWAGQGRQVEARQALADLYGWFSEGFDTPDLRAAKTLLNTLP